MTAEELFELAQRRHRKLRDKRFPLSTFRRWLDERVSEGWMVERDGRYFLTSEGLWIALALDDALVLGDRIAA